jgi:opacity protein-like surface antigen
MMKHIAMSCLAAMVLQPMAWAQEVSSEEGPTVLTGEETGASSAAGQAKAKPAKGPSALEGFHAGVAVGPVYFRDNEIGNFDIDYDTGSQFTVHAGTRFNILRTEIELGSQYAEFDPSNSIFDGDVSIFRATVNAYLDIYTIDVNWIKHGGLTPYIGGGLGVAVADIEGFDDDDVGFTVNGEAGVSFPIFKQIDIVPAYRFEWTDFDEFDDNQKAHTIRVGGRYRF